MISNIISIKHYDDSYRKLGLLGFGGGAVPI